MSRSLSEPSDLGNEVFTIQSWMSIQVLPRVLTFGVIAAVFWMANELPHALEFDLVVAPCAVTGAILPLLLVLRTNAGQL